MIDCIYATDNPLHLECIKEKGTYCIAFPKGARKICNREAEEKE